MTDSFDTQTQRQLGCYVYFLTDPDTMQPFYIGTGRNDRVFSHLLDRLGDEDTEDLMLDTIRAIHARGKQPAHAIVRHGLTDEVALEIEAALIDTLVFMKTNATGNTYGHNAIDRNLMSADEVMHVYDAPRLDVIDEGCVILNASAHEMRDSRTDRIYEAVKEAWSIDENKLDDIKYVLVAYRGLIIEVFAVASWYPVERFRKGSGKTQPLRSRYGFTGSRAEPSIRDLYINKSIARHENHGQATHVRFELT